jgi:hypothetical protein
MRADARERRRLLDASLRNAVEEVPGRSSVDVHIDIDIVG